MMESLTTSHNQSNIEEFVEHDFGFRLINLLN